MEKRVLIERWLGADTQPTPIYDEASVSSARQRVREVGQRLNLSTTVIEEAALIASELTHNQLSHARQGYLSVKPIERSGSKGLEIIAADIGPGIERPALALKDQPRSAGSLRAGLGAVCRIADEVAFDNRISEGFCVIARKFESAPPPSCEIGIMGKPYPGEALSGDDAVFLQTESGFVAAVSDGLGHGPEARQASNRSIETLSGSNEIDLTRVLIRLNDGLANTRGCAMSIARFDRTSRVLETASVGDVHSHLYRLKEAHFFASTPLVLGDSKLPLLNKVRIETEDVASGSVLVMFSDGLKSRTTLKGQLDVLRQPPISIAQHLLESYSRPDDDSLVLVVRFT
jgi:anti-sigma regulatory factor (Ser/Thr protein kinase)